MPIPQQKGRPAKDGPSTQLTTARKRRAKSSSSGEPSLVDLPEPVRNAWKAGWSVVPQYYDDGQKRPFFPWKEFQERPPTAKELRSWSREHLDCLWAVVTGQISRVIVFDFDGLEGLETVKRLELLPAIRTPSGSLHVYLRTPAWRVRGGPRVDPERFPGMDLQADGQLATFHGRTEEGEYQAIPRQSRRLYRLKDLPAELQDLVRKRDKSREPAPVALPDGFTDFLPTDELLAQAVERVRQGQGRNATGFWLACQLRDERYSEDRTFEVMRQFADAVESAGDHLYSYQEAYNSLISAFSEPPRGPRRLGAIAGGFRLSDYGNAERLVARHGESIRYCHPWKSWLIWDRQRWQRDETNEVERRAKETIRNMYSEAQELEDSKAGMALFRHAQASERVAARIKGMIDLAQSERAVSVLPDQLDSDPWLLNVANGTLDLRTGELAPHNRDDLLTKVAPVKWDEQAMAPRWERFLERILPDAADRSFLQRAVGYSLTGDVTEEVLLLMYGTGQNGKTKFIETVRALLGDYAQTATSELFLVKRPGSIPADVARLLGARFVSATETEEGHRLAESLVKQLTGGDRIAARLLYQNPFEFDPTHKLWLATNHLPQVRGTDEAIWRRIRLIPFTVTIPPEERDRRLGQKLRFELPGILRWAVEGCLTWQKDGLGESRNVLDATQQYRDESDVFGQFLEEWCSEGPSESAPAGDLFHRYEFWANANNLKPMSQQAFGRKLRERGFVSGTEGKHNVRVWRGVGLKDTPKLKGVVSTGRG